MKITNIITLAITLFLLPCNNVFCKSKFDNPEKGTFRGFLINESSYHQQIKIWSTEDQKFLEAYSRILEPKYFKKQNLNPRKNSPQIMMLDLGLGTYIVHVSERADITDPQKEKGEEKIFSVTLEKDYIDFITRPFEWEITDETSKCSYSVNEDMTQIEQTPEDQTMSNKKILQYLIFIELLKKK
ncbi:hypothetical protein A2331_02180 [Candidatus Falkowbacteria bacterium RIFOXYB2_FULL_34_18]|uniref:Uncharacterized protein n=1 Tax=Candidatus Falkowbacteria bacterium RIFOXYD2_FULL_34_120 TaxID=1798007 RepID=A0A1F5TRR2_9BACT|nr:MAG: hypothetical protein A2331_02180 [Candidatus Falkowbacteria bacterium RIFOXYB2_FULL_34_18]OGF29523.1 MAG: hypothetical protein A2500_02350 [Candidatus Falkowbacteria bacterium RIFOXYC12_FULL_34_55]OGF36867.1 MAG: hypothetical protein A2466_06620 [Candidatus Falkowbacteria bacterium RIFOXYC2_FULL_34_220]OGF39066.1 MAG: hypothetical protein A2515_04625 [Candidatus Falkowbacteria bacterium RIFOXYD12_FULL_34_57]OGF41281.1 MAG: hypothetical protein A2531_00265 [Candidatus Falkowbacteria bact